MHAYSCVSDIESIYTYIVYTHVCSSCLLLYIKVNYCNVVTRMDINVTYNIALVTRMDINVTLTNTKKKILCNVVTRMDINVTLAYYKKFQK